MQRTGAEIIVEHLERHGITVVAGVPGGASLPLYDALSKSRIRHLLARHEQAAGFIAQGIARATGRAAVCLGTSGPGATNLVTALADAKMDSVPLLAITAQVPRALIGTDAFQEVPTCALAAPVAKRVFFADSAAALLSMVPEALATAESGRPGPVLIDVPKDVQTERTAVAAWPDASASERSHDVPTAAPSPAPSPADLDALAALLHAAERPVLLAGGGTITSGASPALTALARRLDIPVAMTLHGLGAFPAADPLSLGMLGMHAAPYTNWILDEADLLVALGARFDDRATGKVSEFCPNARIAHIDIDPREIGKNKPADLGLVADAGAVAGAILARMPPRTRPKWRTRIDTLRALHPLPPPASNPCAPARLLEALAEALPHDAILTTDVGQHQMWVAQTYPFARPRTLLTSGGLGTMGFGLPAAIGAALARPQQKVVCVTGDGSFLMNLQELDTLRELDVDVTVLVWNNGHLGLVRQQQELFYGQRYHGCRFETQPDFAAIARGFGLDAVDLASAADPLTSLQAALRRPGPLVVNVPIDPAEMVLPMVAPGAANREMVGARATGDGELPGLGRPLGRGPSLTIR